MVFCDESQQLCSLAAGSLGQMVPHVVSEFKKGLFTVTKSLKRFSSIAIDQAHEQNNAMVKGEGGAVGLTENPNALRRWMLSGPEMARVVNEFEAGMVPDTGTKENSKHHEEHRSFQVTFFKDVKSFAAAVEDLGNPFLEETGDLFTLDTKVIAEESAVSRMRHIESLGKEQFLSLTRLRGTSLVSSPRLPRSHQRQPNSYHQ